MRTDLNMSRGKIAVQAGHAVAITLHQLYMDNNYEIAEEWFNNSQVKVVLAINSVIELHNLLNEVIKRKLTYSIIHDAGRTEVEPNTFTCLAVGIEERHRLIKLALSLIHI